MRERRAFLSRMDVKFFSDQAFTVENVLLAMGEIVGHENIVSASRMNKAVVVFCKDEKLVNSLVEKRNCSFRHLAASDAFACTCYQGHHLKCASVHS